MSRKRARILIVDDDTNLLSLLLDTLGSLGYTVEGAAGGVEALEKLDEHNYDVMISDIRMPDLDGISLLRRVRTHYPDLPVLLITGYGAPEVIGRASPDGFLAKPFRISHMEQLIEDVLNGKEEESVGPIHRVMVVDDDDTFRETLYEILRAHDYSPLAVSNGPDAVRQIEEGEIDAVIADIKMPGMDGIALMREIKARKPELPVILITAFYSPRDASYNDDSVLPDGFLQKPFKADSIIRMLQELAANATK